MLIANCFPKKKKGNFLKKFSKIFLILRVLRFKVQFKTKRAERTAYLKSSNSGGLEPEIGFEILSDFPHQTLEGELPDQQLGGLLVSSDLPESHSSGPVSVRLLHSSGGWSGLPGSLGGQLLPGSLSSSGLTSGLLGTGHGSNQIESNCLKNINFEGREGFPES